MTDPKEMTREELEAWAGHRDTMSTLDLVRAAVRALLKQLDELETRCDRLKQEAQIHSMEARAQRATVHEVNQIASGATGEKGGWNGAEPARELRSRMDKAEARCATLEAACAEKDEALRAVDSALDDSYEYEHPCDKHPSPPWPKAPALVVRAALSTTPKVLARVECWATPEKYREGKFTVGDIRASDATKESEPITALILERNEREAP